MYSKAIRTWPIAAAGEISSMPTCSGVCASLLLSNTTAPAAVFVCISGVFGCRPVALHSVSLRSELPAGLPSRPAWLAARTMGPILSSQTASMCLSLSAVVGRRPLTWSLTAGGSSLGK